MPAILIDADACPVVNETIQIAGDLDFGASSFAIRHMKCIVKARKLS